jgi:RHS repeat-associated protein
LSIFFLVASAQGLAQTEPTTLDAEMPGFSYFAVTPCRIFDTRTNDTPLLSGTPRVFAVTVDQCGIPLSAVAVSVNLTVVAPTGSGHITAYPGDEPRPLASTINFGPGQTRANNAIFRISVDGEGAIALHAFVQGSGQVHAILDVNGYFASEDFSIRFLSPSSVLQGGGELALTVIGTGFQDDATVRFDGYDLATTSSGLDRLTAIVPASRLEAAGVFAVQVVNPDSTASEAALFTVDAPLALSALVPAGVATGSPAFSLTLSGAGFKPGAVARFGGTALTTEFIGSGMLTATVPAALVAQPGEVMVEAENPGGSTSSPLSFKMKSLFFTGITPSSGPVGTAVTISGDGLDLLPSILFAKQGGGTLQATMLSSATATSLQVSVPTGTTTGPVRLVSGGLTLTGPIFTVTPSRTFELVGGPVAGVLFPGESVNFGIRATSPNDFAGLIALQVNGLPAGITYKLNPPQLSADQTANLTLSAPIGQPTGLSSFSVTGTASIEGHILNQTLGLSIDVRPVSTSFIGRVAAAEAFQRPLIGVTVRFLGKNEQGIPNGCSMTPLHTDAGGNFAFVDIPATCTGAQLVGFDGTTYSGQLYTPVNLRFDIQPGVINRTPGIIHLTSLYDAETILVRQNWSSDQIFTFQSIPGLKLQIYSGTVFTNPDGSTPDPFPLTGLRIPIDRSPGDKTFPQGEIMPFLVSLQPEGSSASQPVAVDYPNTIGSAPGSMVSLLTLDPRVGAMVQYGTGTISADGLSIVADQNPATPGKRFGLTHFDWHGPMTPIPPSSGRGTTGAERCETCEHVVLEGTCAAQGGCTRPVKGAHSVEYATGAEEMEVVEASITGIPLPVGFVRIYRSDLADFAGPFGLGASHSLSYVLLAGTDSNQPVISLALPNGRQVSFVRQPDGTYQPAPSAFTRGSTLRWVAAQGHYRLDTIDGSTIFFTPTLNSTRSSPSAIADRHGNQIQLVRGVGTGNIQILERIIAANDEQISLQYDAQNRIRSMVDAAGRITSYSYDTTGRLASTTNPAGGVTSYGYDGQNRLISVIDPRGILVVTKEYDAAGRVIREAFPDASEVHYAYLTANPADLASPVLQTQVTDPLGHTTTYRFTVTGELTDITDALGQTVSFEIDSVSGRHAEREGTAGCPMCGAGTGDQNYEYDNQGRLTKITDALGNSTSFTYPAIGQVPETVTDALSRTTTFTQNTVGDVTEVIDPAGKVWQFTYDTAGRLLTLTDPNQHTTTFAYGKDGRLESITDALGRTTQFSYDAAGRLSSTRAPDGTTEYLAYDALDRVISVENALGQFTPSTYDAVGDLLTLSDPKGNTTTFEYDDRRRPIREIAPDGSARIFDYDKNGSLRAVTDRNGHTATFTYDTLGRPRDALYEDGTALNFDWDPAERLLAADDFTGGRVERAYDLLGRLISEISPTGSLVYEYDALSRRTLRAGPDGQTVYTYTQQGQVESITNGAMSVRFSYDEAGRRTMAVAPNNLTVFYTYDAAGQLTHIDYRGPGGYSDFRNYEYDVAGRVSSISGALLPSPPVAPQLASFDDLNRLVLVNGQSLEYDAEGRLLSNGRYGIIWSDQGRLLGTFGHEAILIYTYDALGRRQRKVETGVVTSYVYDGIDVLRVTSGELFDDYLRGLAIDEVWASRSGMNIQTYARDRLGSTIGLIGPSGSIQAFGYDEYGITAFGSAPRFGFTGREQDENGLLYLRNRYFDPKTGRFTSEDPLGLEAGDLNPFRYVHNNPVNSTDPLGLYGSGKDSCNYYDDACLEYGDPYSCSNIPTIMCNFFPEGQDPNPDVDGDFEGLSRCIRRCLQDCDLEGRNSNCLHDPLSCHVKCIDWCELWGIGDVLGTGAQYIDDFITTPAY